MRCDAVNQHAPYSVSNRTEDEGRRGRPGTPDRPKHPYHAHMQFLGDDLGDQDDGGGEDRSEEETNEADAHGGADVVGHEPDDQLEPEGDDRAAG